MLSALEYGVEDGGDGEVGVEGVASAVWDRIEDGLGLGSVGLITERVGEGSGVAAKMDESRKGKEEKKDS